MKPLPVIHAPFMRVVVCLAAGIMVADAVAALSLPWLPLFLGALLLSLFCYRWPMAQSAGICLSCFLLGALLADRQRRSFLVDWPATAVTADAVIVSEPVEKARTMAFDILIPENRQRLKCYVAKTDGSRHLQIGDGLRFHARIEPNREWRLGTFDYRRYLEIHGFTGTVFVSAGHWEGRSVSLAPLSVLEHSRLWFLVQRHRLLDRYRAAGLTTNAYSVVAAMTLGDKSALSSELKEVYSQTGASHVLALSGLHLGIIYSLLSLFVAGRWQWLSQLVTILAVWAFVFLTGLSVSVVRSAVMLTVCALIAVTGRRRLSVGILAFTASCMLLLHPYTLFDLGFQFSFLSVLSILLWQPVFGQFWAWGAVGHWLYGLFAVSLAAQLGVAPLVAYHFGRLPLYFLLTNLIVVPAATAVILLSLVVLLVPALGGALTKVVTLMNDTLELVARLPQSSIEDLHPSVLQTTAVYAGIACLWLICSAIKNLQLNKYPYESS